MEIGKKVRVVLSTFPEFDAVIAGIEGDRLTVIDIKNGSSYSIDKEFIKEIPITTVINEWVLKDISTGQYVTGINCHNIIWTTELKDARRYTRSHFAASSLANYEQYRKNKKNVSHVRPVKLRILMQEVSE